MENFARFYQDGGGFMHLVTLLFLASTATAFVALVRARADTPTMSRRTKATFEFARRLRSICVGLGGLGSLFGVLAALHAGFQASTGEVAKALMRGLGVALNPSIWALLLVGGLSLVVTVVRFRVERRFEDSATQGAQGAA